MHEIYKQIGESIRKLRRSRGVSQEDLARELGYKSRMTISEIENGKRAMTVHNLQKFANYFGVGMTDMFESDRLAAVDEEKLQSLIMRDDSMSEEDAKRIAEIVGLVARGIRG